jgi:hypothetical protein
MNWFHRQVCRSARWRCRVKNLLPWALQEVELGDDVLEIRPGPGVTTDLLRGRTRRLTALEVDPAAAASLRARLDGCDVRVVHGDGAAMPFVDGSFSGVVAFTMLHHVPSAALQDRLLTEARRCLRRLRRRRLVSLPSHPSGRHVHASQSGHVQGATGGGGFCGSCRRAGVGAVPLPRGPNVACAVIRRLVLMAKCGSACIQQTSAQIVPWPVSSPETSQCRRSIGTIHIGRNLADMSHTGE